MMTFTSIASGSSGNAYLVEATGSSPLLIEAGRPISKLREALNFRLTGLAGCLVSHEHLDHAKAVKDLLKAGIECFMSRGTAEALGVQDHHRLNIVMAGVSKRIGSWTIMPFALEHDAAEPLGFVISDGEDRLLFVPDTGFVVNRFDGITLAVLECNHIGTVLIDNVIDGNLPAVVARRIRRNHLSLEVLKELIKANDFSRCRQLWLIHLSDGNSIETQMKREIQELLGVPVYVA